jgi:hypothetical protein
MKHFYKSLLILAQVSFLNGSPDANAQEHQIAGKVVDVVTGKTIEYAYIYNFSQQKSTYSNMRGEFTLEAGEGDTLVMYGIGYYYKKVIVNNTMLGRQYGKEFQLRQQAYDIAEAKIIGFGSYGEFKRQFIALDQPETPTEKLNNYMASVSQNVAVEAFNKAQAEKKLDGISFVSVPILTPEERERIKLAGIIEKETVHDQIYQKYNPMLIKKITGLTDDDEIIAFMVFCGFSDKYLLGVAEYDLMTRIALKFELFKHRKQDEKLMENPINRINDQMNAIA